jgi:tetratricopeptide (TPR) repeat protein
VLRESARLDEAERVLDEAERVMRATLKPDNGAFSNVLSGRSLLASARGQHRRAMAWADASLKLAEGSDDAAYFVPLSMLLRAEVAALADEPEVARRDAEQLLTLWRKTLPPGSVSSNLGRAQLALAQALAQQGQKDNAAAAYAQALRHLVPTLGETGPQTLAARRGAAALQASVR